MTRDDKPTVRLSTPADAVEAIPHLIGFQPVESLVLIGLSGPRGRLGPTMRMDLAPEAQNESLVGQAVTTMQRCEADAVLIVIYADDGPADDPLASLPRESLAAALRAGFQAAGITVRDLLAVRHGRWYSFLCDNPTCCPPEGTPVGREIPSAAGLTLMTHYGPPLANREALAATVAADVPDGFEATLDELAAELEVLEVATRLDQLEVVYDRALVLTAAWEPVDRATLALLIALVQQVLCRDLAVMSLDEEDLEPALRLWREAVVLCPDAYLPQVGAIFANVAWELGQGAIALCVIERVLAVDPSHALTGMTLSVIQQAIRPPARVSRAQPPQRRAQARPRKKKRAKSSR